ncbi:PLP-dependent aminotransferase family protein [Xanthobacter sp. DSM 24535]|uniref:aminotransferase-like domain-containing protein n=1 Tax=Roseixanthobacter psychrophilus TaxID=3119917 RepID=UPI00372CCC5E
MWTPNIDHLEGPRYLAVASAIAQAIDSGELAPGAQLPPQRDLAERLGVTVGTITRAYSLIRKQNLVSGEVGRGTFVRRDDADGGPRFEFRPDEQESRIIDLSCYRAPVSGLSDVVAAAVGDLVERVALLPLHKYPPPAGFPAQRAAAASWISRTGFAAEPENLLLCAGAQQAILIALTSLLFPGETILTDDITFPGFKALAGMRGLTVRRVEMDQHGMTVDGLRAAVAETRARVVYLQSTLHNPTTAIMPLERRKEIAALARAEDLLIIEDDVTAAVLTERPPPIAAFAPEHVCYITGFAKCFSPALRIAFMVSPRAKVESLAGTLHMMTLGTSPLMGELASVLLASGAADDVVRRMNQETARREAIAREVLARRNIRSHPASVHMWMSLPAPWRALDFEVAARRNGVAVVASDHFAAEEGKSAPAVRVSLNVGADDQVLKKGLAILDHLMDSRPYAAATII